MPTAGNRLRERGETIDTLLPRLVARARDHFPDGATLSYAAEPEVGQAVPREPRRFESVIGQLLRAMGLEKHAASIDIRLFKSRLELPAPGRPNETAQHALLEVHARHAQWSPAQQDSVRLLLEELQLRFSLQRTTLLGVTARIYLPHGGRGHDDV